MDTRYLSVVDTAKLIRSALKAAFPGIKFSVRSDSYAGGASIDVGWTDGPTVAQVDAIIAPFSSTRFDGMIDMAHSHSSWYCPEHGISTDIDPGSQGSRGLNPRVEEMPPCLDAERVHFGSDYVHANRRLSPELHQLILDDMEIAFGEPIRFGAHYEAFVDRDGVVRPCRGASEYGDTLFHQVAQTIAVTPDREIERVATCP